MSRQKLSGLEPRIMRSMTTGAVDMAEGLSSDLPHHYFLEQKSRSRV
jgi:hypothetical protein